MTGVSKSSRRILVTWAGLDDLHQLRLKAACSMLAAGYIDATLKPWIGRQADLLVVSADDGLGQQAAGEAERMGMRVIRVAAAPDAVAGRALQRNCSVLQLSRVMTEAVSELDEKPGDEGLPPLLAKLIAGDEGLVLAQDGALRLVVNPDARAIHVYTDITDEDLAKVITSRTWMVAPLEQARFQADMAGLILRSTSIEGVLWRVASLNDSPFPGMVDKPIQLQGWPALDGSKLPPEWLLPIACLMIKPWTLESLAGAGAASPEALARIFAVAGATGLATSGGVQVRRLNAKATERAVHGGFFSRLAKRFGLDFGGGLRGQ